MAMPNSQRYPWNIYPINKVEDIVFLDSPALNSDNSAEWNSLL